MSDAQHPTGGSRQDRLEVRTPVSYTVQAGQVPGLGAPAPAMAGAQGDPTTCRLQAHQLICVSGEVTTSVRVNHCNATVRCLSSGIGSECPTGTPQPCSFKFFQNLCVEVDVEFEANAHCEVDRTVCLETESGPCPPF